VTWLARLAPVALLSLAVTISATELVQNASVAATPSEASSAFCSATNAPPRSFFGWETVGDRSTTWDQVTISVPRLRTATTFATAWAMASNGKPYGQGAAWDQVGWYWWSGRLYLMTWASDGRSDGEPGCPGTSYTLVPNVLHAGQSLTVAVSRSGNTWKTWERAGRDWKELNQAKFNAGLQVNWSNLLESLPGSVGAIPEVCFSGRVMGHSRLPGGCS
jgi:hypothetical protein